MWLWENAETASLLSALLRVIHLEQYLMATSAMDKLEERDDLRELIEIWASVFNGCQIISNQETPFHHDNNSQVEWYDILCSIGPYTDAVIELANVGLQFRYRSGVVFALCGRMLRHGVCRAKGDRVCVAYYMRENVQRRLQVKFAGWSRQQNYL